MAYDLSRMYPISEKKNQQRSYLFGRMVLPDQQCIDGDTMRDQFTLEGRSMLKRNSRANDFQTRFLALRWPDSHQNNLDATKSQSVNTTG